MSASATVWVPILVAIVTALATVITVFLSGRANLRLERQKFEANSKLEREKFSASAKLERQKFEANAQLERQKFEASLVLQATATGNEARARKNLKSLIDMGFLKDPEGKILAAPTPVLPAASEGKWVSPPIRPGSFRWPVRTGADADVHLVDANPVETTVEELSSKARPPHMPATAKSLPFYQDHRARGVETKTYQLEASLVSCKLQTSGNIALILQGTTGQSMVAACPNPDPQFVAPDSRWVKQIAAIRHEVEERYQPDRNIKRMNQRVRVTGVGFFNFLSGRLGEAPNGLELSPVLSIEWLPDARGQSTPAP